MNIVASAWARIENALATNYSNARLNPGVHVDELQHLAPPGFTVPSDFKEMYLVHDSIEHHRPFLLGLELLPPSEIDGYHDLLSANLELAIDTNNRSYFDNVEDGIQGSRYFDGSSTLIPFTTGSSAYLCVEACTDTKFAAHGRVISMDMERDKIQLLCPSIADFLDYCASDFESGIYKWDDEDGFSVNHPEEMPPVEYFKNRWKARE